MLKVRGDAWFVVGLTGLGLLGFGMATGYIMRGPEIDRLRSDRDELHAIADMREALFQQDERKIDAVRWCVTSSPTPIECVRYSLEATR